MQGIAVETPAARFIAEMVRAHPGELSILALGPLTNIALAMQYDPELAPQLVSTSAACTCSCHFSQRQALLSSSLAAVSAKLYTAIDFCAETRLAMHLPQRECVMIVIVTDVDVCVDSQLMLPHLCSCIRQSLQLKEHTL